MMFEKINEAVERLRANMDSKLHIAAALQAIGEHLKGIEHEATGETGVEVEDLKSRMGALTNAVNGIGQSLSSLSMSVASLGSLTKTDGTVASLGERLAALEARATAPAVPNVPQA